MLKTILKVNSKLESKPKSVKVTEGDLSRIGAEKFRKIEFCKIEAKGQHNIEKVLSSVS